MNDQVANRLNFILTGVRVEAPKASEAPSKTGLSEQRKHMMLEMLKGVGTLQSLIARTQLPDRAVYHHLWCMRKDGLVQSRAIDVDGKDDLLWHLSPKGKRIAATLQA